MAPRILIVGAGPVGLMLAALLARHGVRARLVERRAARSVHSKALAVFARTLELLDDLGVARAAVDVGRPIRGARFHADGEPIARLDFDALDSPFKFVLSLPQAETERLLEQRGVELGVSVEREVEMTDLAPRSGGGGGGGGAGPGVDVKLRHADGRFETAAFDWVVGCDGAHSTVRARAGFEFAGVDLFTHFAFADCIADWPPAPDEVNAFFSASGIVAAIPLPEPDLWRIIVDVTPGDDAPPTPADVTLDYIAERVAARTGLDARLSDPRWLTTFGVRQRKVDRYRRGRVLLAGDAAHAHSPVGGQGMNTGLQDAANLAWKLALVATGRAGAALLDSYDAEREPIADAVLAGTGAGTRGVTLHHPFAKALRNAAVRFAATLDPVRQRMVRTMHELVVDYRDSPIVDDGIGEVLGVAEVRAGDRAPDVALADHPGARRLYELTRGPLHTLLIFPDAEPSTAPRLAEIKSLIAGRFADVIRPVIVTERAAAERFGLASAAVVLIRPDGYVAYRDAPPDADRLLAHLTRAWSI